MEGPLCRRKDYPQVLNFKKNSATTLYATARFAEETHLCDIGCMKYYAT